MNQRHTFSLIALKIFCCQAYKLKAPVDYQLNPVGAVLQLVFEIKHEHIHTYYYFYQRVYYLLLASRPISTIYNTHSTQYLTTHSHARIWYAHYAKSLQLRYYYCTVNRQKISQQPTLSMHVTVSEGQVNDDNKIVSKTKRNFTPLEPHFSSSIHSIHLLQNASWLSFLFLAHTCERYHLNNRIQV